MVQVNGTDQQSLRRTPHTHARARAHIQANHTHTHTLTHSHTHTPRPPAGPIVSGEAVQRNVDQNTAAANTSAGYDETGT